MTGGKRIYLDHNATTATAPEVLEAMLPYLRENFGNASSVHAEGRTARTAVDRARRQVAELVGASPEEIFFTSGGTESDNLAVFGAAAAGAARGHRHLVSSPVEHHAVLRALEHLGKQDFEVTYLPVDTGGRVAPSDLEKAIRPGATALVSVIAANNEVGTLQPIEALGEVCRSRGVTFHADAVQAAGKVHLDLRKLQIDLLSLSAHKIYGPKGAGALYIRRGVEIQPQIVGGGQERKRRSGTENVPAIVGFGAACSLALREFDARNARQFELRERLYQGVREKIEGAHLNGHPTERVSNTLNLSFEGVEGEAVLLSLDMAGIAASSGSACASGSLEPSHVLSAMGVRPDLAHNSLRFSLGAENTAPEIDRVVEELARIVKRLRSMQLSS